MPRYRLNPARDVDVDGYGEDVTYMLNLPYGFRFYDDQVHVRGFDTMQEVRAAARDDVVPCDCTECLANM
jgi:hypothetical protein